MSLLVFIEVHVVLSFVSPCFLYILSCLLFVLISHFSSRFDRVILNFSVFDMASSVTIMIFYR